MYLTFRQLAKHIRDTIPDLTWIDRDKGQLENTASYNSIITPGALIDFDKIEWKGLSRGNQSGISLVTVKLIFSLPSATHEGADWNEYEIFEQLSDTLYEQLSGHPAIGDRRGSMDYFTESFYVAEQTFELNLYQTKPIKTIPKPAPDITGTLSTTIQIPQ